MESSFRKLGELIEGYCRPTTTPVAVKLAREGEQTHPKAKFPQKSMGNPLAVCQGMTIARTFGWAMAFGEADHACPFPAIFMGHAEPDEFLKGETAVYYAETAGSAQKMESAYPRWPMGSWKEVWLAPYNRCEFAPDVIVAYGTPAQILLLIQAANCCNGEGVASSSFGRAGCATWLAGVIKSGKCTYMVTGPGERVFAGTQDHEMSFAIPSTKFDEVIRGLEYVRKQGIFRYPVPNLAMTGAPKFPKTYASIVTKKY